ncbi:MAG: bacterial regulatory s, gntR family protein [Caulobacteraceae bacterium]|nr:bacterial regulatory s, gntR family protein [Caulobacteraceae bacterium]
MAENPKIVNMVKKKSADESASMSLAATWSGAQNAPVRKVLDLITTRLREGRFVPGQSIIARDLAAELNLSAAPVREALHILAGQGVIELLPQRSPRIRSLSVKDMIDILAVWRGLGAVGVNLAAARIDEPGNADLVRGAMAKIVEAARHPSAVDLLSATLDYNAVLDRVSGNAYLPIVKGQLHFSHLHRHLAEYWPIGQFNVIVQNLTKITEMILKGDSRAAEMAFMKHLDRAIENLQPFVDAED